MLESELAAATAAPVTEGRLRRRSSMEAPNISLLLEPNSGTASNAAENDKPFRAPQLQRRSSIDDVEMASCKLEPRIEGRIVILTPETLIRLQNERQKWEMSITRTINESVEN